MSPIVAIWIASVVGAGLFFAGGFLAGGSRRPKREENNDDADDALQERLHGALTDRDAALKQVAALRAEVGALEQKLTAKGRTLAPPPAPDRDVAELKRQCDAERNRADREAAKVRGLSSDLAHEREQSDVAARRLRSMEGDLERLRKQLTAAGADTAEVARAQKSEQQAALRERMLSARVRELEAYATENSRLKSERRGLQTRIERLEAAQRRSSRGAATIGSATDATVPAPAKTPTPKRPAARATSDGSTVETALSERLRTLLHEGDGNAAVLADEQGLLLAGVGDEDSQHSMAAIASLALELCRWSEEHLTLDSVIRLELVDGAGKGLRVRVFKWDGNLLTLTSLGPERRGRQGDEETVITAFPNLLDAAS